ncbi:MAG: hypothetical protein JSS70_17980 [Bacteroidetes bacterium]|nr:hypothetical protein [Bacteroidota bacterium]
MDHSDFAYAALWANLNQKKAQGVILLLKNQIKQKMNRNLILLIVLLLSSNSFAQYHMVAHRKISGNEIAVTKPGSYSKPGATYVLANDISSATSPIFLGKDITLDLNGYSIKYAAGNYQHIINSGFEEGLKGWNLSKAPGAKLMNTADVHVFLGKKLVSLQPGDEITSSYVYLPVANRSYFAMCGITGRYYHDARHYPEDEMRVSVYVEDENGNEIKCETKYGDTTIISCPAENKQPRLGGGFVYAHLHHLPSGKYRVRVKAITDCLVDEIDIRPAMDAGISIVENTMPYAHYDFVAGETYPPGYPAFYDYTEDVSTKKPLSSIPHVEGEGSVIIKNGTIESGFGGILSFGIQSSATKVKIILDNVNIKTSGINATAADLRQATITHCRFDVDMPFVIQRHSSLLAVTLRGDEPSEVSYSDFFGGEGCLMFTGNNSSIHHNYFVNHQTVTNRYSVMGSGDGSKIFENRIEPLQGSGVWAGGHIDVFNNSIKIKSSPPTCEYGREEYSVAGIRMADYHHSYGEGFYGNKIYNNTIYITAVDYPPKKYIPMAWGVYYSTSGADNFVFGNDIVVNNTDTSSKALAAAFYIVGGEGYGGQFYNNRITTNVPAVWLASFYGDAYNSKIYNNTIIPLHAAKFKTVRMGWDESVAKNIEFRSNNIEGGKFSVAASDRDHTYSVYWTLTIRLVDKKGGVVKNAEVLIRDKNGVVVTRANTDENGEIKTELPEYSVNGKEKRYTSPYTVSVDDLKREVNLTKNTEIIYVMQKAVR